MREKVCNTQLQGTLKALFNNTEKSEEKEGATLFLIFVCDFLFHSADKPQKKNAEKTANQIEKVKQIDKNRQRVCKK